ncbi:MAG: hypothetical protein KDB98_11000, partial [Flavobacteriales bacterium]|nr:hypothetical protein [Flavobacteriales bacterium]
TLYPNISKMSYAVSIEMNGTKVDTIPTFMMSWKNRQSKDNDKQTLRVWLKQRLELDTVRIVEY